MKNVKKAIALAAVIFGVSTASFAQNGFTVRAGGNFPVGAFGKGDVKDIALVNVKSLNGGAAIGFNAGVKYQLGIIGNLGVFGTADFFYNGLKSDIKEAWKGDNENIKLPTYMNIPVMLGANYTILDIIGTTLWVEAGAGANFRNISSSTASAALGSLISGDTESDYNLSTTFAWQAGIGVSLDNTITLGLHYYAFGSSEIKGETISSGNLGSFGGEFKNEFSSGKLNPSMVVVRLGYTF